MATRLLPVTLFVLALVIAGCSSDDDQGVRAGRATTAAAGPQDADESTTTQGDSLPTTSTTSGSSSTDSPTSGTQTSVTATNSTTTDSSTTSSSTTSTSAAPPSLPTQTLKVTVQGPNAGETIVNATRSFDCPPTCTIELFDWATGPTTVAWATNSSSSVDLEDGSGCLLGNQVVAFSSLSVGQTCTITLSADGDSQFAETSVQVSFKATPAVVFSWTVDNLSKQPPAQLEEGESVTFSVTVTRRGTNVGNLTLSGRNMTLSGTDFYVPPGTHSITATARTCGQTAELHFGVDMAGTVFGTGSGPSSFVWQVVCP